MACQCSSRMDRQVQWLLIFEMHVCYKLKLCNPMAVTSYFILENCLLCSLSWWVGMQMSYDNLVGLQSMLQLRALVTVTRSSLIRCLWCSLKDFPVFYVFIRCLHACSCGNCWYTSAYALAPPTAWLTAVPPLPLVTWQDCFCLKYLLIPSDQLCLTLS